MARKALENVVEGDWEESLDDICTWENSFSALLISSEALQGLPPEEDEGLAVEDVPGTQTPTSSPSAFIGRISSSVTALLGAQALK